MKEASFCRWIAFFALLCSHQIAGAPACATQSTSTTVPQSSPPGPTPTSPTEFSETPTPSSTSDASSTSTIVPLPSSCHPRPGLGGAKAPSVGTLRAAVIFVDFPDAPAADSTESLYAYIDQAPTALYESMSYQKLHLEVTPHLDQFYRMPSNSDSYNYLRGLSAADHQRYIQDAVNAVGSSINFTGTDVLYIMPPRSASAISFSPTAMFSVITADGTEIGNSVTYGQDLYNYWGFKTVNHETGHAMGLPDLYPFSGDVGEFVGGFDLMGLISGQSPDYFAYQKWQLRWIEDSQVDCVEGAGTTTHRISPVEVGSAGTKLVMIPIDENVSVVAEVRSNAGINAEACGTGVLLYTTHNDVATGQGPIRVIDSRPNSGGCDFNIGGELNDAPYVVGTQYNDLGVTVSVIEKQGDDYVIEVTRSI